MAELQLRQTHKLVFRDVDGHDLSTGDGHVTIITVITRQNEQQAREIAYQVPERYIGDPQYRYITLVNFQRKLAAPLHGLTRMIIRGSLDHEARELQHRYAAKNVTRNARQDVYVVADFDGSAVTKLGLEPDSQEVAVFVFSRTGMLVARWDGVPPPHALGKAIEAADR